MLQKSFDKYRSLDVRTKNLGSSYGSEFTDEQQHDEDVAEKDHDNIQGKSRCQNPFDKSTKPKVLKLLNNSFEKFRNIEKVERNEPFPITNMKKIKKTTISTTYQRHSKLPNDLSIKSKRCTAVKRFSKEEDDILLEAYISSKPKDSKRLPNDFYKDLSKKMSRSESSLFHRLKRLKSGHLINKQGVFTLLDDKVIIDAAVENLKEVKDLRNTTIANRDELAIKLNRNKYTLISRWYYRLKPWIMSYHEKTLNLDIRMPLASFVAENFQTIYDIDWDLVLERPEFSGHTVGSIRYVYLRMLHLAAWHLKLDSGLLTLAQVAEDARTTYTTGKARNIPETTRRRQMEVIEYFENVVKKNGIRNFF